MPVMTKAEICRMIPHGGAMCLLDTVEQWDETQIVCRAGSHRDQSNPLRRDNQLEAICGLEYAAQAMAVHVEIINENTSERAARGYIGAVREVVFARDRLDDIHTDLTICASRLFGDASSFMYTFRLSAEQVEVMHGRASLFLKPVDRQG
ncbi:MAG: hypothetical protein ACT4OO_01245 [Nitrospiraceae bacterium]